MCGAYAEALEAADKAAELALVHAASQLPEFHLYRALTLAACFEEATPEEQRQCLEAIQRHQQQLAEWAELLPRELPRARADGVRGAGPPRGPAGGGDARLRGGHPRGPGARLPPSTWGWPASWRRTSGARGRRPPSPTPSRARPGRRTGSWGATGKVQHLEAQWPHLVSTRPPAGRADHQSTDSTQIDALTVVKAQQAISGEIVLERLVTTLMQVGHRERRRPARRPAAAARETRSRWWPSPAPRRGRCAGLGRGPLRAAVDAPLLRPAHARARAHRRCLQAPPVLVRCVAGARQGPLGALPAAAAPGASSPGCCTWRTAWPPTPSPRRACALLGHIASQAAISIENARLYADVQRAEAALRQANDELEQRVEERTRELQAGPGAAGGHGARGGHGRGGLQRAAQRGQRAHQRRHQPRDDAARRWAPRAWAG